MGKRSLVIQVEHNASEARLGDLGVREWPIWTKPASTFDWSYDADETCFFLEGDVVVTPKNGSPVAMGKGDLVIFPLGMECTWEIRKDVRKHYTFG
ncbi:MAG TPA: cupin domain-containing protein [Myxococcales bacterium]|jgi:hypothetical protein